MKTLKVGVFPGRVNEFTVEDGQTVGAVLEMAGIEVGAEQEIKLDGNVVTPETIAEGSMLLVAKRIKGAL